jgi:outer membrane protein OmpA-like peptidoglycan-associated protein
LPQGHLKNPEGVREENRSPHRFLIISQSPRSLSQRLAQMKETDDDQDFQHGRHHRYDAGSDRAGQRPIVGRGDWRGLGVNGAVGGVTRSVGATASVGQTLEAPRSPFPRSPGQHRGGRAQRGPGHPQCCGAPRGHRQCRHRPHHLCRCSGHIDRQYVVLQNDLRGTGVEVIKRNNQIILEMPSDVTFSFNKFNIQPRFYGVLNTVSRTLAKYPATYVDVNGHTDAIGSFTYNQRLSERRADAVADYLADRSVNGARMHVQGFGKTEPIASNATVSGRAANRRVEIILTPYAA